MCFNRPGLNRSGFVFLGTIIALSVLLAGCVTTTKFGDRLKATDGFAADAGFKKAYVEAGGFTLLTYQRISKPDEVLRIYIEGDGKAWSDRVPPDDPTPLNPVALYLAIEDNSPNVAYLARPGQYSSSHLNDCEPVYWSQKRFSPEVINAMDAAVDSVKASAKASDVELVGYSGGGTVAVLVAARRDDVTAIRTVAANLDWERLCEYHHVSPLTGSLNPLDAASKISRIPQHHFFGRDDSIVPSFVAEGFVKASGSPDSIKISVIDGATHTKGWRKRWKTLLSL